MLVKWQTNIRLDKDQNVSFGTEAILDTQAEAEEQGEQFVALLTGFLKGYAKGMEDFNNDGES